MSEHGDAVWRACAAYVPAYDAEDALQNTFLKYAMHDQDFSSAEHEKAWLLRVAINECKDALKAARAKNVSLESRLEAYNDRLLGIQDDSTQTEIGVKRILEAMDALGDPPKTQVYLSLVEGYTASEISEMTNMPENVSCCSMAAIIAPSYLQTPCSGGFFISRVWKPPGTMAQDSTQSRLFPWAIAENAPNRVVFFSPYGPFMEKSAFVCR